jgi:hypothetical protein
MEAKLEAFQYSALNEENKKFVKGKRKVQQEIAYESSSSSSGTCRRTKQQKITYTLQPSRDASADNAVAKLFYAAGIPFSVADHPYFIAAMQRISEAGPAYSPPKKDALACKLLDREYDSIENQIRETLVATLPWTSCTLVTDGKDVVSKRHMVNFVVVCPKGAFFCEAIDVSGQPRDAEATAAMWMKAIEQIETIVTDCVVLVVSDSPNVNVKAGQIMQTNHPRIFWGPCVAHGINLFFKDLVALDYLSSLIEQAKAIVQHFTNRDRPRTILRRTLHQIANHTPMDGLYRPGETRFATHFRMIDRLVDAMAAYNAW